MFASDLVIWTEAGQTERICAGDSGGPYIKRSIGLELVAGVHHGTDRSSSDFCPKPGEQWGEKLTWNGPDDLDWLLAQTNTECETFTPEGRGNNYARCFRLPLVNDAPEREQVYGSKDTAVALVASAVL